VVPVSAVRRILRKGEGTRHAAAVCRASKLGRTAISFDDGGNWRCRRVSDLSRYRQAQIGAAEVRQRRMSRRGRSGGNCSSCTPSPRQFSLRAAAVTRQNVLINSRPSGSSRRLPTPGQVQHGQRRVAAASSQLLRRGTARPNQAIDPDRSNIPHSEACGAMHRASVGGEWHSRALGALLVRLWGAARAFVRQRCDAKRPQP
jgi:hypothetical protein